MHGQQEWWTGLIGEAAGGVDRRRSGSADGKEGMGRTCQGRAGSRAAGTGRARARRGMRRARAARSQACAAPSYGAHPACSHEVFSGVKKALPTLKKALTPLKTPKFP